VRYFNLNYITAFL